MNWASTGHKTYGMRFSIARVDCRARGMATIKRRTPPTNKSTDLVNVFAGIIKCKKCGKAIHVHNPKSRPKSYLYCSTKDCDTKMINIDKVEHEVILHLEQMLERIQLREQDYDLAQDTSDQEAVIAKIHEIEREIEADGDHRNNLHDLLESGVYTKDIFLERMHTLQERGQEYERNLKKLRDQLRRIEDRAKQKKDIKPLLISGLDAYKNAPTIADKNKILKQVISRIEYRRDKAWKDSNDFELDIYLME